MWFNLISMAEDKYSGEVYFIVPRNSLEYSISDWIFGEELLDIHSLKEIDQVYLKKGESYKVLESLCDKEGIPLERVEDNAELFEEITKNYGEPQFKRVVYASNTEDVNSLKDIDKELADWGFFTRFRLPHSS